jgi:hypothetical protein
MAITYSDSTLSLFTGDQGAPTISIDYVGGVAAGNIAVVQAAVKDSSAVFADPTGYLKIGEEVGGTGTAADDVGTTKVAAWYRILDGTETADVVVSTDAGNSMAGGMTIYAPTDGSVFNVPIMVSGSDDVHAADWNPTGFAGWPEAVAPGDVIVGVISVDTDVEITATDQVLAQTGITFDEVNPGSGHYRIKSGSSGGFDCALYSYDWSVVSGSNATAPTYTHTPDGAACGAMLLIRLRENYVGGGTYQRQIIVS